MQSRKARFPEIKPSGHEMHTLTPGTSVQGYVIGPAGAIRARSQGVNDNIPFWVFTDGREFTAMIFIVNAYY